MLKVLEEDLYRYEGARYHLLSVKLRYYFFVPGYRYTYFLRKCQGSNQRVQKLFWLFRLKICSYRFSIQIPAQTQIGRGFRIAHWGAIVVNPHVIIGENCTIAENVLIGNSQGKNSGSPIIGNSVNVGANAVIIGGITIGNDVLIAPGAFVNFDVPDNSIVIGNPGKIIKKESSPVAKYIVYDVYSFK